MDSPSGVCFTALSIRLCKARSIKATSPSIKDVLFSKIGLKKINFVEIGFDFYQNNSLNFLGKVNKGLFIDGSENKVIKLKSIIALLYPFKNINVIKKFIDKDNLNSIIDDRFHSDDEIDFFSIDVDGNDYYLFENLKVRPKVICIEYNFWYGPDVKCSVPYDKNFIWEIFKLCKHYEILCAIKSPWIEFVFSRTSQLSEASISAVTLKFLTLLG